MLLISKSRNRLVIQKASRNDLCEAVYILISLIPPGYVTSYGSIARTLGVSPRLVAWCLKNNKQPIVIPCHRVVHSNLELGGYTGASREFKKKLLEVEGVVVDSKERISRNHFIDIKELLESQ